MPRESSRFSSDDLGSDDGNEERGRRGIEVVTWKFVQGAQFPSPPRVPCAHMSSSRI